MEHEARKKFKLEHALPCDSLSCTFSSSERNDLSESANDRKHGWHLFQCCLRWFALNIGSVILKKFPFFDKKYDANLTLI